MAALDELRQLGDAWQNRPQLIEQARQEGATWVSIAEALHMTRQGAVKLHATLEKDAEARPGRWTARSEGRIEGAFAVGGISNIDLHQEENQS